MRTDGAGRATLAIEDAARTHLMISPAGRAPHVVSFDPLRTSGIQTLEIGLPGRIEGQVEFADGSATAGVIVGLCNEGFDSRTARVDEQGRFAFDDVEPGTGYLELTPAELLERLPDGLPLGPATLSGPDGADARPVTVR